MSKKSFIGYKSFEEYGAAHGLSVPKPTAKTVAKQQVLMDKFELCPKCGGKMTLLPGTNVFICENPIETTKVNKDTLQVETTITPCSNRKILDERGQSMLATAQKIISAA